MDVWGKSQLSTLHWNTSGKLGFKVLLCFLTHLASRLAVSLAASRLTETFDSGASTGIPDLQCSRPGWSIGQSNEGNYAFATCPNECTHNLTVIENVRFIPGTVSVWFHYALNVQGDTTSRSVDPILNVYCDHCSTSLVWSSQHQQRTPIYGKWTVASVDIKQGPTSTDQYFSLTFEANLQAEGQVIGLDSVLVETGKTGEPLKPSRISFVYPSECDGDTPPSPTKDNNSYPADDPTSGLDGTATVPFDNSFGLLDNETTLLFAQILAILSVTVCFITVAIHCLIWRKQRRLHRVRSTVPLRAKPPSDEPHDSMLLEMNLVPSDEPDQPCSNSLTETSKTKYLELLKDSRIPHQSDHRRATVSHGSSPAHRSAILDDSDEDSDDGQQRPHPRTKSLPGRPPVNVYESIDEVGKYQPLTFGKRPAPGPPGIPGGRRLNSRTRGVQNLAAVRKYRPSSVQYEEIGDRKNALILEEVRDRSKSASHYDYVKRKSGSQSPRHNVWKYGQAPRPKGRAPPPPINRLYDEPVRRPRSATKADSAPTLLLQNHDSSCDEAMRTDNESVSRDSTLASYHRPSTSANDIPARSGVESTYFTLEPPTVTFASSEDSDDERETDRDISRFEDAEEPGTNKLPNGANVIPLRPLVSAPIDIPPPTSPTMADFDEESSCL